MSKYTPSPWVAVTDHPQNCVERVYSVTSGFPREVATLYGYSDKKDKDGVYDFDEERNANTRLIAAAPDLLEALKDALKTAEFESHPFRAWHKQARAAIEKAEGKV